jgi:8-oxo-dGTP pyrophosphatase MutT (NUDIX family)
MRAGELIRAAVLARDPIDAFERRSIDAFIEHFDQLADPCNENADPVHVTGSAIVIGDRGVVLHLHKRLGTWLQPGGHVESGEWPWDAALREAQEETGLDVRFAGAEPQLVHVDVHPGPRGHTHLDMRYLLLASDQDPAPAAGESPDVRWFGWEEAMKVVDERLAGALRSIRDRLGQAGGSTVVRESRDGGSS